MIEREGNDIVIHCDFCSEYIETEESDFNDAMEYSKHEGWKTFQKNNDWQNSCPSCFEDWLEEQD